MKVEAPKVCCSFALKKKKKPKTKLCSRCKQLQMQLSRTHFAPHELKSRIRLFALRALKRRAKQSRKSNCDSFSHLFARLRFALLLQLANQQSNKLAKRQNQSTVGLPNTTQSSIQMTNKSVLFCSIFSHLFSSFRRFDICFCGFFVLLVARCNCHKQSGNNKQRNATTQSDKFSCSRIAASDKLSQQMRASPAIKMNQAAQFCARLVVSAIWFQFERR